MSDNKSPLCHVSDFNIQCTSWHMPFLRYVQCQYKVNQTVQCQAEMFHIVPWQMFSEKSDRVRQQTSRMARDKSYAQIWNGGKSQYQIKRCQIPTSKSSGVKFQHQNQAVSNSNIKIKRMSDATNCTSLQCKLQRCKTTDDVNPRVNVRFSGIFWSGHSRRVDPCAEGFGIATNAEIRQERVYFLMSLGFYCFIYMRWVLPWSSRTNLILDFLRLVDSISVSLLFNPCVSTSSSSSDIMNRYIGANQ